MFVDVGHIVVLVLVLGVHHLGRKERVASMPPKSIARWIEAFAHPAGEAIIQIKWKVQVFADGVCFWNMSDVFTS